ncbi:MAG: cupredoxin domain-containing protein [Spongiibacteraceae bacterium]
MTVALLAASMAAVAEVPVIELTIRGHLFIPAELVVPANTKIKLIVINADPTPEEFESYELNREKIIVGNSRAVVFIGPLEPGEYPFFGEFNMSTAQGKIIAK